jgi:DNA-binding transcriptional MerR regulator
MFGIGDFAKLGRVSVRMLRHYDAIGLLTPASVDPASGYRLYRADQLGRLNRILALKDLGFTLEQVQVILDDKVTAEELRGMLRLRRAQLEARLSDDTARLTSVDARLRTIEREGTMPTEDVILKPIAPVRVAELTGIAASYDGPDITPVIKPLYPELFCRLATAKVVPTGPSIAYYDAAPDVSPEAITVHASVPVEVPADAPWDFTVVDLPGIEAAATIVHRGGMDEVGRSFAILGSWLDDNGYRMVGYAREVCLEFDPDEPAKWVHELQVAVTRD